MPEVRLFLIRHAETVDNIAGLYAGVRDSALTVHGVNQAGLLGTHLANEDVRLTHMFSSPLQRTCKTAEAVRVAQVKKHQSAVAEIRKVQELIEQDFGYYEGKPFFARSAASPRKSGKDAHRERHRDEPGFVDVESKESMAKRSDIFLDEHLLPLFDAQQERDLTVVVVSHGMLLSSLWKRMLLRLPRKSLSIAPAVTAARGDIVLEHLGGWSNTGYLELLIETTTAQTLPEIPQSEANYNVDGEPEDQARLTHKTTTPEPAVSSASTMLTTPGASAPVAAAEVLAQAASTAVVPPPRTLRGWSTTIVAIDSKQHLAGLKRQRGGIGRLAHDESQKKLDGFFKKQRTG